MAHAFLPSVIKRKYLARNVRHALSFRYNLSQPVDGGAVRLFSGQYYREMKDFGPTIGATLPFGWVRRRVPSKDQWMVGPWWWFFPDFVGDIWYLHVLPFVKYKLGAIADPKGRGFWAEHRWWPTCFRFSDYDDEAQP